MSAVIRAKRNHHATPPSCRCSCEHVHGSTSELDRWKGCAVAMLPEILLVSGVALDLVGAGVLSHAHNAESIVELRENIGEEGSAVGEPDAISTHAQLLAEKRIGFLLLTLGLVLYLSGIVLEKPRGSGDDGAHRGGCGDRRPGHQPRLHQSDRQPDTQAGPPGRGATRSGRAARAVGRVRRHQNATGRTAGGVRVSGAWVGRRALGCDRRASGTRAAPGRSRPHPRRSARSRSYR